MTGAVLGAVTAEVVSARSDGAAQHLTLAVARAAQPPRPGQFLQVPPLPGEADVLPRTWWLAGGREDPAHGTTLEAVVPGGTWHPGDELSLRGPVGRGFPLPSEPVTCVVVGHEAGQAPARWLAALLRDRGCATTLVLSARDADHHLDLVPARRVSERVLLTAPEELREVLRRHAASVPVDLLYAAGPLPLTEDAAGVAVELGAASQVTAFDAGGGPWCGVGLCGTCAVELAGPRGRHRIRPCAEGPVVRGDELAGAARVSR